MATRTKTERAASVPLIDWVAADPPRYVDLVLVRSRALDDAEVDELRGRIRRWSMRDAIRRHSIHVGFALGVALAAAIVLDGPENRTAGDVATGVFAGIFVVYCVTSLVAALAIVVAAESWVSRAWIVLAVALAVAPTLLGQSGGAWSLLPIPMGLLAVLALPILWLRVRDDREPRRTLGRVREAIETRVLDVYRRADDVDEGVGELGILPSAHSLVSRDGALLRAPFETLTPPMVAWTPEDDTPSVDEKRRSDWDGHPDVHLYERPMRSNEREQLKVIFDAVPGETLRSSLVALFLGTLVVRLALSVLGEIADVGAGLAPFTCVLVAPALVIAHGFSRRAKLRRDLDAGIVGVGRSATDSRLLFIGAPESRASILEGPGFDTLLDGELRRQRRDGDGA